MIKKAERQEILIEKLAREIEPEMVEQASAISSATDVPLVIVEQIDGGYYIIDGFHRVAGMLKGGVETLPVIVALDEDLAAAAAEPWLGQDQAIRGLEAAI